MGMKTLQEARANFEQSASVVQQRYTLGVQRADWHSGAVSDSAESNFNAAMSKALANKTRQAKIRQLSNQDWQNGAIEKGAPIIGTRMKAAAPKYEQRFGPIYAEVQRVVPTLPSRTIDPMTNIDQRLKKVVQTWRTAAGKE